MKVKPVLITLAFLLLLIPACSVQPPENIYQKNFHAIAQIIDRMYYKPIDFQKCAGEKTVRAIAQSKDEDAFERYLEEMFGRCLDSHSKYILSRDVERDSQDIKGAFGGVGLELFQDEKTKEVMILGIIPGGPADGSGITEGDIIVQVDNNKIIKETKVDDVVNWIRGQVGTNVVIRVRRQGVAEKSSFSFTRRQVAVDTVFDYATPLPSDMSAFPNLLRV